MRAQFVSENISFERGKNPKYSMGIGQINKLTYQWKALQLSPGIGSLNLKIMDGELNLEIYASYIPGSVEQVVKNVEENMGTEYFEKD